MDLLADYSSGESDGEHSKSPPHHHHTDGQSERAPPLPLTSTTTTCILHSSTSWPSSAPTSWSPAHSPHLPSTSWPPLPSSAPASWSPAQTQSTHLPPTYPLSSSTSLSPKSTSTQKTPPLFPPSSYPTTAPLLPPHPMPLFPPHPTPLPPPHPTPLQPPESLSGPLVPSPLFPLPSPTNTDSPPAVKRSYKATGGSSTVMGYVSNRKRKAEDSLEQHAPSANLLSPYLPFNPPHSPPGKQAKRGATIPRLTETVLQAHTKPVLSLQWHPCNHSLLLSASLDGGVRLWDVATKDMKCVMAYNFHSGAVRYVDWATDTTALSAGYDRVAVYMDAGYGREITRLKHSAYVSVVKSHPLDRNLVLTGDHDGKLQMWDLRDGKRTKLYKGACGKILDAAFLPKHKAFVASADIVRRNAFSQAMNVWDLDSGVTLTHQLYFEPFTCPCLKVHGSRDEFLAQSNGNYVVLFSATKPFKLNKRKRFQGHFVSGFDVGFDLNPDGSVLCSASSEGKVHFYNYVTTKSIRTLTLTDSATLAVSWNQNVPFRVAISDWNGKVHILR